MEQQLSFWDYLERTNPEYARELRAFEESGRTYYKALQARGISEATAQVGPWSFGPWPGAAADGVDGLKAATQAEPDYKCVTLDEAVGILMEADRRKESWSEMVEWMRSKGWDVVRRA